MPLEVEDLSKRDGDHWVLQDPDLAFGSGVVSPSGAGKSTLLRITSTGSKLIDRQSRWTATARVDVPFVLRC